MEILQTRPQILLVKNMTDFLMSQGKQNVVKKEPFAKCQMGSAKLKERLVQEELVWKKEAQTSHFLCEHLLQNGKAKPLCGYLKSDQ